jgi:hypothetical protein
MVLSQKDNLNRLLLISNLLILYLLLLLLKLLKLNLRLTTRRNPQILNLRLKQILSPLRTQLLLKSLLLRIQLLSLRKSQLRLPLKRSLWLNLTKTKNNQLHIIWKRLLNIKNFLQNMPLLKSKFLS